MRSPDFIPAAEAAEKAALTAKQDDRSRRAIYLYTVEKQRREYERLCELPKDDPEVTVVLKETEAKHGLRRADTAEFLRVAVDVSHDAVGRKDDELLALFQAETRRAKR